MNDSAYFRNVLNFDKSQVRVLALSFSDDLVEVIRKNRDIEFVSPLSLGCEYRNYLSSDIDFSPESLKDVNYCYYLGDDNDIIFPLLASGITIIKSLDFFPPQQTIERVENYETYLTKSRS